MKKLLLLVAIALFISCGGEQKISNDEFSNISSIEGFYNRIGTIQIVKGVPVDTIFFDEVESEVKPRQVKAYASGHFAWINNLPVSKEIKDRYKNLPWKSGAGGFGTYSFNEEGEVNMYETLTNLAGSSVTWEGEWIDNVREEGGNKLEFKASLKDNIYSQLMENNSPTEDWQFTEYAELFEKMDEDEATEIDGVWKHIANVRYINGVAIDTTALPEGLDDHKIFHKGNVIVNFDYTLAKSDDPNWGGAALAGNYSYNDNKLIETFNFSTGNWRASGGVWPPTPYRIDWIDEDTFIQIWTRRAQQDKNGELEFVEIGEGEETRGMLNVRVK